MIKLQIKYDKLKTKTFFLSSKTAFEIYVFYKTNTMYRKSTFTSWCDGET